MDQATHDVCIRFYSGQVMRLYAETEKKARERVKYLNSLPLNCKPWRKREDAKYIVLESEAKQ